MLLFIIVLIFIIASGIILLSYNKRSKELNNKEIDLTPKEYSIIKLFIENPNKAFSRDELMDLVWGEDYIGDPKIVDVNIRRLRSKIECSSLNEKFIETIWGFGYRWRDD